MPGEDDDKALKARLDRLGGDIGAAKPEIKPFKPPFAGLSRSDRAAMSLAMRASSEIVAGVAVGGVIGYGLDWLLGFRALFLIAFALLGAAAGVWNVLRATAPKSGG
jgi:ATP synthase protein I